MIYNIFHYNVVQVFKLYLFTYTYLAEGEGGGEREGERERERERERESKFTSENVNISQKVFSSNVKNTEWNTAVANQNHFWHRIRNLDRIS